MAPVAGADRAIRAVIFPPAGLLRAAPGGMLAAMVPDIAGLRAAFRDDPAFRALIEFCGLDQPRSVTRVVRITGRFGGTAGFRLPDLLRKLAHLAELGCGQLLEPNRKTRARFAWRLRPPELLHLATHPDAVLSAGSFLPGFAPELPTLAPPADGMSRQTVPLLPGRQATFVIPEDLSEEEAQWLGSYLARYARQARSPKS